MGREGGGLSHTEKQSLAWGWASERRGGQSHRILLGGLCTVATWSSEERLLATLTSRLPEYLPGFQALTQQRLGKDSGRRPSLEMKACVVLLPTSRLCKDSGAAPALILPGRACIELARQRRVLSVTFVVIEVIKPELQGPDAAGREGKS